MPTRGMQLATFLREDEAAFRIQDLFEHRLTADADRVAVLLNVVDLVFFVDDSDERIVTMDNAHYFASGICVPGWHGSAFIQQFYPYEIDGPEHFLRQLARTAQNDNLAWDKGAVRPDRRHLGWFGTSYTRTSAFGG